MQGAESGYGLSPRERGNPAVKCRPCTSEWRTTQDTHLGSPFHQTIAVVLLVTRKIVIAGVLWAAMMTPALVARSAVSSAGDQVDLLSAEQGEALVQFALDSTAHLRGKPDCSHLVHLVYSRAGLRYGYQPSRTLYRGTADFERVKKPQPGDLIVWRGHVGIVVSPGDKTFFSSVRSGIITESWTADQWLKRGRPRFYRYHLGPDANPEILARLTSDDARPHSDASSNDLGDGRSMPDLPEHAATAPGRATPNSAAVLAIIHQHRKPGKKEIEAAFVAGARASTQQLLDDDTRISGIGQATAVAVFRRAEVQKIRIKKDKGSVTIRLTETMAIEQGRVFPQRTLDRELVIEQKMDGDSPAWVLTGPQQAYVPAAQALTVFQHCAELMLHNDPNSSATRTIVKALDVLYDRSVLSSEQASLK